MPNRPPDALVLITRRHLRMARRWHWQVMNLVAFRWAEGYAATFEEARDQAQLRARLGPDRPLPDRPDPSGAPEAWPNVNLIPYWRRTDQLGGGSDG